MTTDGHGKNRPVDTGEDAVYDPDRCCPKCSHDDVFTSYESNSHGYSCMGHSKGFSSTRADCEVCTDEHFHRGCRRCGYRWREELPAVDIGRDADAPNGSLGAHD